ncbi:MAG: hypothetical protein AAFX79_02955 [Planctomycetota bacterium]
MAHAQANADRPHPANLETPQACVEHFFEAAKAEDWARAAESLNPRLAPDADPSTLAEQLACMLKQELWIDWSTLPDRAEASSTTAP